MPAPPEGSISPRDRVLQLVQRLGVLRPKDLEAIDVPREYLRRLRDEGLLEQPSRGLYVLAEAEPTEHQTLVEVCKRVPQGVVCLLSALQFHRLTTQLPHHSDRGGQYAGKQFRAVLRRAGIRQSMSRAADCYDNAFMESCFGTIETELEMVEYESTSQSDRELAEYFAYYNGDRKHSSIGYRTPVQFEFQQPGQN